jgi:glycerophosphoryl diester phosphodiesterase
VTQWIGHRGAPRLHLENTLPSFLAAIAAGADAIELDVHVTADGVPVVHHDPRLPGSMTPSEHRGKNLAGLESAELRSVRLRDLDGTPVGIPTLEEVLAVVRGRATAYVELKGGSPESVAKVLAQAEDGAAIHSFDHRIVRRMFELLPGVPRGLLFDRYPSDVAGVMAETAARDLWPRWGLVNGALVEQVHMAGGRVIAWTVNTRKAAHGLLEIGVDGICTDDIHAVRPEGGG